MSTEFEEIKKQGDVVVRTEPKTDEKTDTQKLPPFNVILLNDESHTAEYVIEMLGKVFAYQKQKGYLAAVEVHNRGRVILATTHKEQAELYQDQIHGFGKDFRIPNCEGSMSAVIEPAEGETSGGSD